MLQNLRPFVNICKYESNYISIAYKVLCFDREASVVANLWNGLDDEF
jgi:hypothetical protein